MSCSKLTLMVSRVAQTACKEANSVTTEVFKKVNSDADLSLGLQAGLRSRSLNAFNKEIIYFRIVHAFNSFAANFRKHKVSLFVFIWVVKTRLWARF